MTFQGDAVPRFKTGEIRVLAVADAKESPFFPGVKTAEAQGYKVYGDVHRGLVAPGNTPKEVIEIIDNALKKAMVNEELKKKCQDMGYALVYLSSQEYTKWWDEEDVRMKPLIEQAIKEGGS